MSRFVLYSCYPSQGNTTILEKSNLQRLGVAIKNLRWVLGNSLFLGYSKVKENHEISFPREMLPTVGMTLTTNSISSNERLMLSVENPRRLIVSRTQWEIVIVVPWTQTVLRVKGL